MNNYVITSDVTTDLKQSIIDEYQLKLASMQFFQNGKTYMHFSDYRQLSSHDFYQALSEGKLSTTSQITPATYLELFEPILQANKDILHIGFSSGLSGTYNASKMALDVLKEKYPDRTCVTIDSLAASAGQGLLVYEALKLQANGASFTEVENWVESHRLHLAHWFTVSDLNHLKRGGRISSVSATLGNVLSIRPILHVDDEGHLVPKTKARGNRKALHEMIAIMENTKMDPYPYGVFISHSDELELAELLKTMVEETFGITDIHISDIDPVIGSHTGKGTVALYYFATQR